MGSKNRQYRTTQWQKTIGGSNSERPFSINTTNDGGIIVAGQGESANGDATINYGIVDYWIVKLNPTILSIQITHFDAQKKKLIFF